MKPAAPAIAGYPGKTGSMSSTSSTSSEDAPGMTTTAPDDIEVREGTYGDRVVAVEPGGAEFIPLGERHGRPIQLFWTWTSPNMEFATIFVGLLGVWGLGLSFWSTVVAIVVGTALGAITHAILSTLGPTYGVPQMVLSRRGFGYWGNVLPAGLNSLAGGIGWFAVNSVSGALALNSLTKLPDVLCLLIVVVAQLAVAFLGHNLIHAFERYAFPVLVVIFLIASVWTLSKAHPGAAHQTIPGAWLIIVAATFGYAVGWNPYAADYTRYMKPETSKTAIALWAALGLFLSCVLLETVGAAAGTIASVAKGAAANPTAAFTSLFPTWLADLTLLAIAIGAVAANAVNIYSGALSFNALGFRLPLHIRRAIVALGFGAIGFFVAWSGLSDAGTKYTDFLLIIAYWIAPWLAVVFCDMYLRRRQSADQIEHLLFNRKYTNWAGPVAMAIGGGVAIGLFSNQSRYIAPVPSSVPALGDLTFEVGFVLTAVIYLSWRLMVDRAVNNAATSTREVAS
jgi:nucleobase:cation symporter-1, NCS1 family